MPHSDWGGQAS